MKKKSKHRIPKGLSAGLARVLRGYRRGLLRDVALRRTAQAAACTAAVVVLSCAFDRLVDVPGAWRAPLPWLAGGVLCILFLRMLAGIAGRPDYDRLAHELDRAAGDNRDHLRTVLDLSRSDRTGGFFAGASCEVAAKLWGNLSPHIFVRRKATRRWLAAAAVCLGVIAVSWMVEAVRAPLLWQRFLDPMGNHPRPTATWFEVDETDDRQLLAGDDMEIRARLAGRKIELSSPLIRIERPDGTYSIRRLDRRETAEYAAQLKQLQGSFTWQLTMGPVRSRAYHVPVLPRPSIAGITVTYNYPRYSRIPSATENLAGRTIAALAGTRVQVTIRSDVELARAEGVMEDDTLRFRIARENRREAVFHHLINDNRQMRIRLVSTQDIESKHELPLNFRAIADNPPSVSIINDIDGKSFFLTDTLEIAYRAQDDIGLSALYIRATGDNPRRREPVVYDVNLPEFGAEVAEDRLRIPVSDLISGETRLLNVSLLAKDTRDQDGQSPAVTVNIASDSFDRQLRALLRSYTGVANSLEVHNRGLNALPAHEQRLANLRNSRNKITILADGLDANQPVGANQKVQVDQIRAILKSLAPPFHYGTYWFGDFRTASLPPRFRELGEYANIWSYLAIDGYQLAREFERALGSPGPKTAMLDAVSKLNAAIETQEAVAARVADDYRQVVRELAGYLASTTARQSGDATELNWQDENFAVSRRAALQEVLRHLTATLQAEAPDENAMELLAAAAAVNSTRAEIEAAVPALESLARALRDSASSAVDARLDGGDLSTRQLVESVKPSSEILLTLASGMMQGGDQFDTDELFLLETAMRLVHIESGSEGAFQPPFDVPREDAFNLFNALMRCCAEIEHLRLGVSSGRLHPGSPEAETRWLRVRESRFALRRAVASFGGEARGAPTGGISVQCRLLIDALAAFADWLPARELQTVEFMERLRGAEQTSREIAASLRPVVESLLRGVDEEIAARTPLLAAAISNYSDSIQAEMDFFTETKTVEFANLHELKVRLASMLAAGMKFLDFAELAALYGVGGKADVERLAVIFTGLSQVLQHFDEKIEAMFWTHRYGIHTIGIQETMWVGKVNAYRNLKEKVDTLRQLSALSGVELDSERAMESLEKLQVRFVFQMERQAIRQALAIKERLESAETPPVELSERGTEAAVDWERMHYLLKVLQHSVKHSAKQEGQTASNELQIVEGLRVFEGLPRDVDEVLSLLDGSGTGEPAAGEIDELLSGVIEDISSALPPREQARAMPPLVRDTFAFNVDWSAIDRAKHRSRQRLVLDRRMLDRAMLNNAVDPGPPSQAYAAWAAGEVEVNRRKAGLSLNRTELGGLALAGGSVSINLPEHIYHELTRAREGAMPVLFRDQCYEYLNLILQKARK